MIDLGKMAQVVRSFLHRGGLYLPCSLHEAVAGGIIDRQAQMHARAFFGQALTLLDLRQERAVEPIAAPDDIEADRLGEAAVGLRDEIAAQQAEERLHFRARTEPVIGREGIQRQRADVVLGGGAHHGIDRPGAGAMAGLTVEIAGVRPAPVAVHDDCDVHVKYSGLQSNRAKKISSRGWP